MQVDLISTDTVLIGIKRADKHNNSNPNTNFATKADFNSFLNANRQILQNVTAQNSVEEQEIENNNSKNSPDSEHNNSKPLDLFDLRLCGVFTEPLSLLVTGPNDLVTRIEKAWFMRLLQPPQGFMLQRLGKISQLTASLIRQRPAAKLSDACLVSMNILTSAAGAGGGGGGPYLAIDQIRRQLSLSFPNIVVPDYHIVKNMLNQMAEQLMIYNVGGRYATTASIKKEMENQNDEEK